MRFKLFLAATAVAVLSGVASTAGAAEGGILYSFLGKLSATPSGGKISITVQRGNPPALRAMLGKSLDQTFAYGDGTEFLQWSDGTPTVVKAGDLDAGDYVRVNVRAPRGSSLDTIESTNAVLIGDHGTELNPPDKPLYLFRGKLASVGSSSLTVDLRGGNRRALRLLRGKSRTQTFTVGSSTVYLLWRGIVPTVTSLSELKPGDAVVVRIRADAGSTLGQVESTAATTVAEHEAPASSS